MPIVYERARVGGVLFYRAPLKYVKAQKRSGKGAPKADRPEHYQAPLLGYLIAAHNAVRLVRVELNGEIFYDIEETDGGKQKRYKKNFAEHISFQGGESTQTTLPLLIDLEGTTTLPRFKKTSILWLKNIDLSNYGNTFPTVSVIVKSQQSYPSIGAFLRGAITFSGINEKTQADFGFDILSVNLRVNKIPFYGAAFTLDGTTPLSWMQPFVEAWNLRTVTENGRTEIDTVLPYDELSYETVVVSIADLLGIESEPPFEIKTVGADAAASQIALSYIDIDGESTPQVAYASLNSATGTDNTTTFDIKSIMPAGLANTLAERMLRNLWSKNKVITFTLPIVAIKGITNGVLVRFEGDDLLEEVFWLIVSTSLGDKGFVEYSGVEFNPAHYAFSADNVSTIYDDDLSIDEVELSQVRFALLDIPLLDDADSDRLNPYYALDPSSFGAPVYLYSSTNNLNYLYLQQLNKDNYFASVVVGLPEGLEPEILYTNTSFEVEFTDLTVDLLSTNQAGWIKGAQLFEHKGCVYSYKQASFIGSTTENRWEIKGLIVGWRGTGTNISVLGVSEEIVFIKNADISPNSLAAAFSATYVGFYYSKLGISSQDDIANNIAVDQNYQNVKARAASVQILPAKVFSNGTIQIRWVKRSTSNNAFNLIDEVPQPNTTSDGETFVVKIFDSTTNALLRTASVTTNAFYNYTLAQQTLDDNNSNLTDLSYTVIQQSNHRLQGAVVGTPYDTQNL